MNKWAIIFGVIGTSIGVCLLPGFANGSKYELFNKILVGVTILTIVIFDGSVVYFLWKHRTVKNSPSKPH